MESMERAAIFFFWAIGSPVASPRQMRQRRIDTWAGEAPIRQCPLSPQLSQDGPGGKGAIAYWTLASLAFLEASPRGSQEEDSFGND